MGVLEIPCQSDKIISKIDNGQEINFDFNEIMEKYTK